ncbi:hypothetical protein GCM10007170_42930 [Arthrobacter liuii]|uniref:Uncharacterized protein n=1 Tax=Arthrobacter liuii TaxID=1476996 RepID=A0ABQ2AYE0_9MICC|nr:hypothetical protein GCM10007170_42930 [Arthrobacter liuii]
MLLFQQGIKHVQFALAWVPFRVTRHAGPDRPAGQLSEVLQHREAAFIWSRWFPRVTANGEDFGNAGVVAVPDYACELITAFDAPCGQVRDNLVAKVGKLDGGPDGGPYPLVGQAGNRQGCPGGSVGLDAGGDALGRNDLQPDRQRLIPGTVGLPLRRQVGLPLLRQ